MQDLPLRAKVRLVTYDVRTTSPVTSLSLRAFLLRSAVLVRAATPSNSSAGSGKRPLGLLWIGSPIGTHAGLLILVGGADDASVAQRDPGQWPLPLSRSLGVRIYEGLP